ncbi:MAG: DUF2953 domain-containing protein [Ruminococcus sp.]|nr:DUF2953 domain-containing protein [Ruminococcus sp.]
MAKSGKKRSKKGAIQLLRMRTTMLILLILVTGFGAVSVRLAYLQLVQGTYLQEKAVEQQLVDTTVNSKRGTIYDSKGKVLAQSASVWKVVLAPAYLETEEQRVFVSNRLSKILDLNYDDVYKKTKQKTYYVVLKRKIESDEREQILKLCDELNDKFSGLSNVITLFDDYRRYYPYNDLASSVIGFTGSDDQGLEGVEYQYDKYLTGTPGRIITARNANQTDMPFQYEQNVAAKDGNNITLTIDETIQSIAEKYMKKGITDNKVVNRGVCIIMNVNTGAILSMVTVDGYDLNKPYDLSDADLASIRKLPEKKRAAAESAALGAMWSNKAVADTYYPGSVFKMCTASMALNEGVVNENSHFYCSGSVSIYDHTIHCHFHSGHGSQNLFQAIANSCNPAFIDIGSRVGADKFYKYYQAFGFSEPTGIDLPGESDDLFFNEDGVKPHSLSDILGLAQDGFAALTPALKFLTKHIHFRHIRLYLAIGTDDPANTATLYGKICAAAYNLLGAMQCWFDMQADEFRILADFYNDKITFRGSLELRISPMAAIILALILGCKFLWRTICRFRREDKEAALREKESAPLPQA